MVPKLIIIKSNGTIITDKGRKDVFDKGVAAYRVWMDQSNLDTTTNKTDDTKEE